jgi:hypothetical protein
MLAYHYIKFWLKLLIIYLIKLLVICVSLGFKRYFDADVPKHGVSGPECIKEY